MAEDSVDKHGTPKVDYAQMRREADEFFGNEGRMDDDDPWDSSMSPHEAGAGINLDRLDLVSPRRHRVSL